MSDAPGARSKAFERVTVLRRPRVEARERAKHARGHRGAWYTLSSRKQNSIIKIEIDMSSRKRGAVVMVPVQSKMARAALDWRMEDVAKAAKVAPGTIVRFEAGEDLKPRTVDAIQRAYESAGIEFTNGDAPGVRASGLTRASSRTNK